MSKQWPNVRLGELLRLDLDRVPIDAAARYPMVGVLSFGRGLFEREPIENGNSSYKHFYRIKAEHVVMSQLFGWEGALALSSEKYAGKYLSPKFPTFLCDTTRLDRNYLGWVLRRPSLWNDLGSRASGMGDRRRTLNPDALFACEIPLPTIDEQQQVVEHIESLAEQINDARLLRQKAAKEAAVLWKQGASRVFVRAEVKYPLRPLAECVSIKGGGTPSKANPLYWLGTIPWVTPKDMKVREINDSIDHISEDAITESSAKRIEPGAVLIVVRGMILLHTVPTAILRVPAAINQDMKALIPKPDLLPEYLSALFWALNDRILALVEKSTHDTRKLETPVLLATKITVPPLDEQRRIVTELDALHAEVDALKRLQAETSAELDALLPAILDRAFKGEL